MPFTSKAQKKFMFAKHPKIAKRFAKETPKNAKLPEYAKAKAAIARKVKKDSV